MGAPSGIRLEWLVKAGAVMLAAVLVMLTLNSLQLLTRTRGYLEGELAARLMNLKEIVSPELEARYTTGADFSGYLGSVAARESIDRIRLIGPDSAILADSSSVPGIASAEGAAGISGDELKDVWGGLSVMSDVYWSDDGLVRSFYFPLHDLKGQLVAVCELTLDAQHIENLTELGTTHFMLKALAVIFLILGLLYMMGTLLASQKKMVQAASGAGLGPGRTGSSDDVTFVISSFQTVVRELKEKEQELRELKDRAEEKARIIESYNENILKSVQSGVVTFDADGTIKTLNPAATEMLGIDHDEAAGSDVRSVFGGGPWLCEIVDAALREAQVKRRGEGGFVTAEGARMWLGAGTSPLVDGDGRPVGAILVFTDLSEVKQLRDRMELKERMTLIGEMSAGIAHELRNPMAVISGYAKLLARRLGQDQESLEAVESMQEEIRVMDDIIREFMNFARPAELNLAPLHMAALLEEAARSAGATAESPDISIEVEDGLPEVFGDPVLLRQAFVNIMANGLESMDGRGTLAVRAARSALDASDGDAPPGGGFVRVDFSDTGRGIPAEDIKKIYTPFYTTKTRGTGLGLALVHKIVVHHGGRVSVDSEVGRGTTFSVYLPVKTEGEDADG